MTNIVTYKKTMLFIQELLKDEIVIYVGDLIVSYLTEVTKNSYGTLQVVDTELDFISVATGMALNSFKKIIVVFDDNYLFKHYSSLIQASASRCKNLFFVLLVTNNYLAQLKQQNLYKSVGSVNGMLFELGFLTHIYTRFFKNRKLFNELKDTYYNFIGPAIGIIEVNNNKYYVNTSKVYVNSKLFVDFVRYAPKEDVEGTESDSTSLVIKEN